MQVWKNRNLRFKVRTIAAFAMASVLASNLGPLEAKASDTVISCPGGGSFTVSDNGAGEVFARDEAFSCGGNVVIPEGVTRIGLFQTPNISRIEIPASVRSIDGFAFANSSLATVVIAPGSNLGNISGYAFANTRITSFRVPAGVTSVDDDAFSGCASLTSFIFEPGNQLQSIGLYAFRQTGLTSINLPESVTTIANRAFYEAQSLTSVSFGANSLLTTIGEQAFASTALTSFAVGPRVQSFNFQMVPPNTAVTIDSNNPNLELRGGILFGGAMTKLINYPSSFTASSYVIPSTVTEIATDAFRNARFTSVTIPDSVTTIGWRAFEYSMLESVTIPASVTSFGLQAFLGTSSLRSVTFAPGSALTRLGYRAFQGATNLTSIDLRPLSSLVTIEYMAFVNTGLTSAALPASLESIEQETFMDSGSLSTVTFEGSSRLRHIGEGVFRNTSVSSIAIPATPVRPGYTFVGWTNYQNEPLQDVLANVLLGRGTVASWQEIVLPTVTAGSTPDSQVASIPTGLAVAEIPATATLPKVVLSFATTSGTATATVVPIANPAAASATPFMVTNTTKIVDINLTGVTGPVTVCLDGAATDNIFHFTGGAWVALPQRTYVNGQVCGVTTNFSPFAAAEPRALTPVASSALTPVASSGPVGPRLTLASRVAVSTNGQSLALKGVQLSEIFSVKLDGKDIKVTKQTDGELVVEVPAGAEGFPTLELKHSSGTLTYYKMIQVIKPYELTRSIKITRFVGSRPTLAGLSALYKVYRADMSVNVLTCVITVASDASGEEVANAESLGKSTCQRVVNYSRQIKNAQIVLKKEGAAGSKPVVEITFDRTLSAVRG
jgi:uncharacterized repeat protein (TIGR02543 family)